jgi:PTS system ascorbate-specific IIA component
MFNELIAKNRVIFAEEFSCWEDAIRAAAQPLLRDGAIKESYILAMIECIHKYGPYIVIAPDVAMPHAKGVTGVIETSMSFMKVNHPVHFGNTSEHDARLLFVIASIDDNSHLEMLQILVENISDDKIISQLLEIENINDLKELFPFTESVKD